MSRLLAGLAVLAVLATGLLRADVAADAKTAASSATPCTSFNPFPPMVHPIRIGIGQKETAARLAVWAPGAVFVDGHPVFNLNPGMVYMVTGGRIVELGTGRNYVLPLDRRSHVAASDYRIWADNRWYRGIVELINFGRAVTVINLLDMEEYLLGVVPSEMPSSWNLEALKAQAVAARSYAWAHMGPGSKWYSREGYELVPDVRDQAYKGLAAEANSTFKAVSATRGIILKNSGKVKPGFYRAWVGDSYENLNIRKKAIPSPYLEKITTVPHIVGVTVKQWDATGNALSVQIMGETKSREVYGVALAKMLGLDTAGVLDVKPEGGSWVFTYRGPGNGSRGLSQHGANMLANNGWKFDQILTQYYQDNDGKLRLDYVDRYHAPPMRPPNITMPAAQAAAPKEQPVASESDPDKSTTDTEGD